MAERPSPSSIAVCSLIALYSDPSSPLHDLTMSREKQSILNCFLDDIASVAAANSAENLAFLLCRSRDELGENITSLLEETLEMAIESIDSLIDLMDSLRAAINEGLVDPSSSHGIFLRSVCLGFEELSFESVTQLWTNLNDYLHSIDTWSHYEQENLSKSSWHPSGRQIERLARKGCIDFELGNDIESDLSFESIELQMHRLKKTHPDFCKAYFQRFLNCLRNGERTGAIQALHQYFDQAMVQQVMPKDILQFSAVLLAMAHSSFGGVEMSLMATEEAVRVAQQSKDKYAACVAFALGWLFKNDCNGHAGRRQLLQRCATRAMQGQLHPLVSGANLSLSTHLISLQTPTFTPLPWMALLRASTVQPADNLVNLDRPTHLSQVPNEGLESVSKQAMVSAAIWTSFNVQALAGISSTVALEYNHYLFKDDVFATIENISLLPLSGFSPRFLSKSSQGLPSRCAFAHAICSLIKLQQHLGFDSGSLRGCFLHRTLLLVFEWSINRCDLGDAKATSIALDSSIHNGQSNFSQLALHFGIQQCRHLCRKKEWQDARECAKHLLDICDARHLKAQRAHVIVNQALIELEADSKHFIASLSPLLAVLTYCEKNEMHGMKAVALSILAKVHLRSQRPKHALAILNGILPTLQQHEHLWFQAEAQLTLAKCYIRLMKNRTTEAWKDAATSAEMRLSQCKTLFEDCHDMFRLREVYYLQAQLYSNINRVKERDTSSRCFVAVTKHLSSKSVGEESSFLSNGLKFQTILERRIPWRS